VVYIFQCHLRGTKKRGARAKSRGRGTILAYARAIYDVIWRTIIIARSIRIRIRTLKACTCKRVLAFKVCARMRCAVVYVYVYAYVHGRVHACTGYVQGTYRVHVQGAYVHYAQGYC
jgi:hypothetical protein